MSAPVLVVEDRRSLAEMLAETLRAEGYEVEVALRGDDAVRRLGEPRPLLAVVTDLKLPGTDGLGVLRAARAVDPQLPVFLITGFATVQTAVEALKLGARDYFTKPLDMETVLAALWAATEPRKALLAALPTERGMPAMVGTAPAFVAAVTALRRVAPTEAAVLLLGPSGSGKELFARALHHLSPRRAGPFVAFNCAAVPETLVESELFGHERGAFTGATSRHVGRFELAHGGTLFLDEVGEIPLPTQSKLLRAVEERRITRLGGESEVTVDVRILAATNRDLEASVAAGAFRRDLFHRLHVFPIRLPALVERRQDIPALVLHLAARSAERLRIAAPTFAPAAMAALVLGPWPGNVRELANVVERAIILRGGEQVGCRDLGLDPTLCRPALGDSEAASLALALAGSEVGELEAFLGVRVS
ncbi:MAG TPA: sigma-54 dependent transcriptional regulator [Thermoanaerobaculaceae bacterium]|nr:sigma-54 dependent transcriptional regulator [Thermoanaerobaculaceae bacterium]HRS14815.1 sigma-54 dependent transcriptional regulator [Thermoanaerobaculaceae bacterium]